MKRALYVLVPFLAALAIRIAPTLITGVPFHVDSWDQIRQTELLLQHTPTPLNSIFFDGYNNFWPITSIFGTITSQVTALPPITSLAVWIPIAAALTIPIFYTLIKKLTESSQVALIASALLSVAFPYALFTAGITKETFANPIYIALILVFLLKHNWKTALLFSAGSVALVLTHHLTAFFAVAVLASITVALHLSRSKNKNSTKTNLTFTAITTATTALYLLVFAADPLGGYNTTPNELLTVGAYQIFTIAAATFLATYFKKEKSPRTIIFEGCLGAAALVALLFAASKISLLPTAPLLPLSYLLVSFPFIISIPLISNGLAKTHQRKPALLVSAFWILPIIAFGAYSLFSNQAAGLTFAVRSLNFMLPPLCALTALGIHRLIKSYKHPKAAATKKILAATLILAIGAVNVHSVYAAVSLNDPYLGYFGSYQPSEFQAANWVSETLNNQTVAGDSKMISLLSGYFNKKVDVWQGYNYLSKDGSAPEIIYIYKAMYKNGYVLGQGFPRELPENWTDKLANYNLVYVNSEVEVYAKK